MKLFRNQSGQGMTEYIIIVAVIAVAAIAAFTYFGKTVRNQTAGMAEALSGDETAAQTAVTAAGTAAEAAATDAATEKNLSNYVEGSGKK